MNRQYVGAFEDSALRIVGHDEAGEPRVIELQEHPFFVATLFQPERAALRGQIHPLINGFVAAAVANAEGVRIF